MTEIYNGTIVANDLRSPQLTLETMQLAMVDWCERIGGPEEASTHLRARRFLEEAIELAQACGVTAKEGRHILDYVFTRPVGEVKQEVGGVGTTLMALCNSAHLGMHQCVEDELVRIHDPAVVERCQRRQFEKHEEGL